MFLTGTHASRPAADAVGKGALYACSDHNTIYQTNGAAWSDWYSAAGASASNLVYTLVTRTNIGSNLTFTSTTHTPVDTTNLSITETIGARAVLLQFSCRWSHSSASGTGSFSFEIDGTNVLPSTSVNAIYHMQVTGASTSMACILSYVASVSSGSHTFKPTVKTSGATLTVHQTASTDFVSFSITELYAL